MISVNFRYILFMNELFPLSGFTGLISKPCTYNGKSTTLRPPKCLLIAKTNIKMN